MKKLMVLDGNSIINRAYYGIRPLSAPDGTPTNAVYGFLNILNKLLREENPDALCVCFDVHAPTFRHQKFADYKAQRKPMPEDLRPQIPLAKEILAAMRVPVYAEAGWEADDLIGTIARRCEENQPDVWRCIVVTGDRDSLQLITPTTTVKLIVSRLGKTDTIDYTPEKFYEDYGFVPAKIVDLKALWGDASDNIPGVPGVGEKTARELLVAHGSLEKIYGNIDSLGLRDSLKKKLIAGKESAEISYDLATIRRDAPIDFVPAKNARTDFDGNALFALFSRLNFQKFIKDWKLTEFGGETSSSPIAGTGELDLFSENSEKSVPVESREFDDQSAEIIRRSRDEIFVLSHGETLKILCGNTIFEASEWTFPQALSAIFSVPAKIITHDLKSLFRQFLKCVPEKEIQKKNYELNELTRIFQGENSNNNSLNSREFVVEKNSVPASENSVPAKQFFDVSLANYVLDPAKKIGVPADFDSLKSLYKSQISQIENEPELRKLLDKIELPLTFLLAQMENSGIAVEREKMLQFSSDLDGKAHAFQNEIFAEVGEIFNLNSPKQLGAILFEKLGLPAKHKTKSGYSTDAEVLKELAAISPVCAKILSYRQLVKIKSITDGFIDAIAPDGRIHTTFNQTVTVTGRLSSSEPNLQNVPARGELGSELRRMFVAKPGCVFVDADYSQVELRVLAHISGDPAMQAAFKNGEDIHAATACNIFHCVPAEITSTMRRHAKAVNFGIVYGIGEFALAKSLEIPRSAAKDYMQNYFKKFAGVREYMDGIIERARERGFVKTLLGRRRNLPELADKNKIVQKLGERLALNTPIQGSAADIMKVAMLRVASRLEKDVPAARIVLQIHDELIVETPAGTEDLVKRLLTEEMQSAFPLAVPLVADSASADNWLDAK